MHGIDLIETARLAETYGDGTVRIGTDQNFIFSGIPEARLDDLLSEPLLAKYSPFPAPSSAASLPAPALNSVASPWWRPRSAP